MKKLLPTMLLITMPLTAIANNSNSLEGMTLADFLKLPTETQQVIMAGNDQQQKDQQDQSTEQLIINYESIFSSDHKDNGGDGILQEDGEIVLRDFVRNNYVQKMNARTIIKKYPEVQKLFKKLALSAPSATHLIFEHFENLEFIFVDGQLPLLPSTQTGFDIRTADVQIAIKRGKKVMISTPAFERTREREYLIIHEILHHMVVVEDDWTALKHTKVREITHYIKNNINNIEEKEFNNLLRENIKLGKYDSLYDGLVNEENREVTEFLLDDKQSFTDRCDVYKIQKDVSAYFAYFMDQDLIDVLYLDADKCLASNRSPRMKKFYSKFPGIVKYTTNREDFLFKRKINSESLNRKELLEKCKSTATKSIGVRLNTKQKLLKNAENERLRLISNYNDGTDASDHFVSIIINDFHKDYTTLNTRTIPNYNINVAVCRKVFSLNRFYNVK
jgi:hypothetical protein